MPSPPPLSQTHPYLAAEWHPDNDRAADDVAAGSTYRARWRCAECGWEWSTLVFQRGRQRSRCPACIGRVATPWNNLAVRFPDLAAQWHPDNDQAPDEVVPGSKLVVRWRCGHGHEWEARVAHRAAGTAGTGCPICAGRPLRIRRQPPRATMRSERPDLVEEWHPDNDRAPHQVGAGSSYRARWRCRTCGWEWSTTVRSRVRDRSRCPACAGRVVTEKNNLGVRFPDLAGEWVEGQELSADQVVPGSFYRARWRCRVCGWEWTAHVYTRTKQGAGCPACAGRAVTPWNNLSVTHPAVAAEWHPDNDREAGEVTAGSRYRARWRCTVCAHEWERRVNSRTRPESPSRCPRCASPPRDAAPQ